MAYSKAEGIEPTKPKRWILRAFTYADLRHYDRDRIRERNGHTFKRRTR